MKRHSSKNRDRNYGFYLVETAAKMKAVFISGTVHTGTLLLLLISCTKSTQFQEPVVAKLNPPPPDDLPSIPTCEYKFNDNSLLKDGWVKVFEDNFAGSTLDLTKWAPQTGGGQYNGEIQNYQPSNIEVKNGVLQIEAVKKIVSLLPPRFSFTSGKMVSKKAFSPESFPGKVGIYARIKLPAGNGLWPAFWTYKDPWPTQGEIDILEAKGGDPFHYQTNYFYGSKPDNGIPPSENEVPQPAASKQVTSGENLTICFNVFGVEWSKHELKFYLNGQLVNTKQTSVGPGKYIPNLVDKWHNIVLNLAVGGEFVGYPSSWDIDPGIMSVDWVKVYESDGIVSEPVKL